MSETNATTETVEETKPEAPAGPVVPAPFARITGRVTLPDGRPVTGATLSLDPLPCPVCAVVGDGAALVVSRVKAILTDGRVSSLGEDGESVPYVDVVGYGAPGVTPRGVWGYALRLTGPGVDYRAHVALRAGVTYDVSRLLAGQDDDGGDTGNGGGASAEEVKALTERMAAVESAAVDVAALSERVKAVEDGPYKGLQGGSSNWYEGLDQPLRKAVNGHHYAIVDLQKQVIGAVNAANAVPHALNEVGSMRETVSEVERILDLDDNPIQKSSRALNRLSERVKTLEDNGITSDDLDSVLDNGAYGSFPWVARSQGKPAEQYGAATISETFPALGKTVIAIDKDLAAVKNGPYKVSGLSANGGRREGVERDLAGTMTHISETIEDMDGVIRNVSQEEITKALHGSEETGGLGALSELSEGFQTLDTRLKAVEAAGAVPGPAGPQGERGPAGPQGPQGEPGAGVREQTAWTKLTNLPANLVKAGDGNGVYVRRHGSIVYMAIRGANPAAGVVKFDAPDGYKHSFSMAAMGVLIPADAPKLAGKLQFGHNGGFEWKGAAGVTDLGYGVLSYPTNDPWPES